MSQPIGYQLTMSMTREIDEDTGDLFGNPRRYKREGNNGRIQTELLPDDLTDVQQQALHAALMNPESSYADMHSYVVEHFYDGDEDAAPSYNSIYNAVRQKSPPALRKKLGLDDDEEDEDESDSADESSEQVTTKAGKSSYTGPAEGIDLTDEQYIGERPNKGDPTTDSDEVHECDECGKTFDTASGLGGHKSTHSDERTNGNDIECSECGDTFKNMQGYGGHRAQSHDGEGQPIYSEPIEDEEDADDEADSELPNLADQLETDRDGFSEGFREGLSDRVAEQPEPDHRQLVELRQEPAEGLGHEETRIVSDAGESTLTDDQILALVRMAASSGASDDLLQSLARHVK